MLFPNPITTPTNIWIATTSIRTLGVSLFGCYQSECVASQVRKISASHNHAREKAICNIAGESKPCTFDIHHWTNVNRISQVNLPSSHFSTTTMTKQLLRPARENPKLREENGKANEASIALLYLIFQIPYELSNRRSCSKLRVKIFAILMYLNF